MNMRLQHNGLLTLLLMVAMLQLLQQQVEARKKFCGEVLNEALDMICVNGFSRRLRRDLDSLPRTAEQMLRRKWHLVALKQSLELAEQRHAREALNAAGAQRELRRPRRRIAHECCHEGCTYEDIMEYCA